MTDDPSLWPQILAVGIPAVAAIVAAVIAALAARSSRRHEVETQRVRDLEARIAGMKHDVYEPMIDLLRGMFDATKAGKVIPQDDFNTKTSKFMAWVTIYGSDDAVVAFSQRMQAAFHSAPPSIMLHLYADFVLAARRDMGYPDTSITRSDYLAMRLSDLYDGEQDLNRHLNMPLADVARELDWSLPWSDTSE